MSNIRDAVWGFIVGDALGVPYEFTERAIMKRYPAADMVGYGTYDQPSGTWSDDSSLMMLVLENIINKGTSKDLAALFIRWYKEGYMTAHGNVFDIGDTTKKAFENLIRDKKPLFSAEHKNCAAGNGTLMRCLPYAFKKDLDATMFEMVFNNSITHRNNICDLCCYFYVKMMRSILEGSDKQRAMESAIGFLKYGWRITDASDEYQSVHRKFKRIMDKDFKRVLESEIESTGYVLSTLEAAVWCFLNTSNYKNAVLKAVNLGGDTDTIAALTGGLAGLYYGYKNIPEVWINKIVNKKIINNLLNQTDPYVKYI